MPKRKKDNDFDRLLKKFKKLERKVLRRCSPSTQDSEFQEHTACREPAQFRDVAELLDGSTYPRPGSAYSRASSLEPALCVSDDDHNSTFPAEPAAAPATAPVVASIVAPVAAPKSSSVPVPVADPTGALDSVPIAVNDADGAAMPGAGSGTCLDSAILEILGEDPTTSNVYGPDIHKDLALRLEHTVLNGLPKDLKKQIAEKYLLPSNCKLIDAPALNAEIKAATSEAVIKRDKSIELRQKQIAIAISSLGLAINNLLPNPEYSDTIKILMDTERLLCDSQHADTMVRRNFVLSGLKKDMKEQIQNTKPDSLLFGQNLNDTIRIAKAINKSGADLKIVSKPQQAGSSGIKRHSTVTKNLNWKGPYPPRKPPNHPKAKEASETRGRPTTSLRPLQRQPTRSRR